MHGAVRNLSWEHLGCSQVNNGLRDWGGQDNVIMQVWRPQSHPMPQSSCGRLIGGAYAEASLSGYTACTQDIGLLEACGDSGNVSHLGS